MKYEVRKIWASVLSPQEPEIPEGYEPFAVQTTEYGCYIWVKKIIPIEKAK